jgi:hypothetical protein
VVPPNNGERDDVNPSNPLQARRADVHVKTTPHPVGKCLARTHTHTHNHTPTHNHARTPFYDSCTQTKKETSGHQEPHTDVRVLWGMEVPTGPSAL